MSVWLSLNYHCLSHVVLKLSFSGCPHVLLVLVSCCMQLGCETDIAVSTGSVVVHPLSHSGPLRDGHRCQHRQCRGLPFESQWAVERDRHRCQHRQCRGLPFESQWAVERDGHRCQHRQCRGLPFESQWAVERDGRSAPSCTACGPVPFTRFDDSVSFLPWSTKWIFQ